MWRCRPHWRALSAPSQPPQPRPSIVRAGIVGHAHCASPSLFACSCRGLTHAGSASTYAAGLAQRRSGVRSFASEAARTPPAAAPSPPVKASQSRRAAKLAARAAVPSAAPATATATPATHAADAPAAAPASNGASNRSAEPSVLYSPLPKPRQNRASMEDMSRTQLLHLIQTLPSTYPLPDRKHMPSLSELSRALEAAQQYRRRYGLTRSLMGYREFGLCIDVLVWSTHKHAQLLAQQGDQQSSAAFKLGASASATHNLLQKLVKEAVTRGYLRGNLPTCRQVLDAFFAAGQYYRVLNLFDFLQSAVQADHARALQQERAEHALDHDGEGGAAAGSESSVGADVAGDSSDHGPATGAAGIAAASIAADPPSAEVEEAVSNVLAAAQLLRTEHSELFVDDPSSSSSSSSPPSSSPSEQAWYHRPHPLLHLDRHAYHVLMRAQLALGFTHQALELVQHTMPQVALLTAHVEGLRSRQAWHRKRATMEGAWAGSSSGALMAAAIMPSTESFLLAFEAACRSGAHAQARDLYMSALRSAERDFHAALPRLLQFVHSGTHGPSLAVFKELVADTRRAGLPGLDQVLHQQILEIVAACESRKFELNEETLLLPVEQAGAASNPAAAEAAAAAAVEQQRVEQQAWADDGPPAVLPRGRTLSPALVSSSRDAVSLSKMQSSSSFPPAFLLFHRENFFQFVWCTSAAAPARLAPSGGGGTGAGPVNEDMQAAQEALSLIQTYLRNPTWMRTWVVGPPLGPLSLLAQNRHGQDRGHGSGAPAVASTAGSPGRLGSGFGSEVEASSPLLNGGALLSQNPCTTLEILLRLYESRADHAGAVSLYERSIIPAIEGANLLLVRRLLARNVLHSLDHPDPRHPVAIFHAGQRLRLVLHRQHEDGTMLTDSHQPQKGQGQGQDGESEGTPAIFTITSIPPFLQPPIAALSPAIYNLLTNAYCQLAQRSGHAFVPGRGGGGSGSASAFASFDVAHFFCMLEERALMRTLYTNAAAMHRARSIGAAQANAMWSHRDTALTLPHVLSVLHHLPAAQWQLCKQIVDRLVRGVIVPVMAAEERAEQHALGGHERRMGGASSQHSQQPASGAPVLHSAAARLQLQSIHHTLMSKYFSLRKYAHLLSVYELDHLQHTHPALPLSVAQSILVVQAYAWAGNLSIALELLDLFRAYYTPAQRVPATAFMVHFLETHVIKAIRQQQQAQAQAQQGQPQSQPFTFAGLPSQSASSGLPLTSDSAAPQSSSSGAAVSAAISSPSYPLSDPFESLPLPSQLLVPGMTSTGSPIVSASGGPAYRSGAGFMVLPPLEHDAPAPAVAQEQDGAGAAAVDQADLDANDADLSLPSDPTQRAAMLEAHKVEVWKLGAQARMVQRITGVATHAGGAGGSPSPSVPVAAGALRLHASNDLYDDEQFLVLPMLTPLLLRRTFAMAPLQSSRAWHGSAFSGAPQGATFSFGLGSPAFSSYATGTAHLATSSRGDGPVDPLVNYHLSQIHGLLTQLVGAEPALLHYAPAVRRCDLRAGVAYNRGRCVIYLLSLWIKSQTGVSRTYQFLLPRTMLRVRTANETTMHSPAAFASASAASSSTATTDTGAGASSPSHSGSSSAASSSVDSSVVMSDLEHVMMHSYSAEFLLSQYFPGRVSARLVERSAIDLPTTAPMANDRAPGEDEEERRRWGEPLPTQQQDEGKNDSFGVPLAVQPYALFSVQWP